MERICRIFELFTDRVTHRIVKGTQLGIFIMMFAYHYNKVFEVEEDYKFFETSFTVSSSILFALVALSLVQYCVRLNSHAYGRLQIIIATIVLTLEGFYIWCKGKFPLGNGSITFCILIAFAVFYIYWDSYFLLYRIFDTGECCPGSRRCGETSSLIETCVDDVYYREDLYIEHYGESYGSCGRSHYHLRAEETPHPPSPTSEYTPDLESTEEFIPIPSRPPPMVKTNQTQSSRLSRKRSFRLPVKGFKVPDRRFRAKKQRKGSKTSKDESGETQRLLNSDTFSTDSEMVNRAESLKDLALRELAEGISNSCPEQGPSTRNLSASAIPGSTVVPSQNADCCSLSIDTVDVLEPENELEPKVPGTKMEEF